MTDIALAARSEEEAAALSEPHLRGCANSFSELRYLLAADLYRYEGDSSLGAFLKAYFGKPGYNYTVWMRSCGYLKVSKWSRHWLYYFFKFVLVRKRFRYGIVIPEYTKIGPGFFINRFGGIYVNGDAVIGSNVNFTHGVVLGQANRGKYMGSPIIGDEVFLATGAKVIGRIHIGDRAVVGANSVATKDVARDAVVGGIPAREISRLGSAGYVNRRYQGSRPVSP